MPSGKKKHIMYVCQLKKYVMGLKSLLNRDDVIWWSPFHRWGKLRWRQRPTQQHTACRWLTGFPVQFSLLKKFAFDAVPIMNKFEGSTEVSQKWDLWSGQSRIGSNMVDFEIVIPSDVRQTGKDRYHKYHLSCLWLHGLQPTRLLCLWDFSGKNTEGIAIPFSRSSSQPGGQTHVCKSPALAGRFFTADPPGKLC